MTHFLGPKGKLETVAVPVPAAAFVKHFKLLPFTSCLLSSSPASLAGIRHETSYQNTKKTTKTLKSY